MVLLPSFLSDQGLRPWHGVNQSTAPLQDFDVWFQFDTNPLYAILHEAIYCQGGEASNWSGQRVRDTHYKDLFDAEGAVSRGDRVLFTGEGAGRLAWCSLGSLNGDAE